MTFKNLLLTPPAESTKFDKTPSSAWEHPPLLASMTGFGDCRHRHWRIYGHGHVNKGSGDHGPLRLNVSSLPGSGQSSPGDGSWRSSESSTRCSQQTLTARLSLQGLSSFLPCQQIQLTRWWSDDSSAALFTRVSKTYDRRSGHNHKVDHWPRA